MAMRRKPKDHTLRTTSEQFHETHRVLDKARRKSTTVNVSKEALTNLLLDHSKMIERLERIEP